MRRELDPAEVEECLRDLDVNRDGKITFDEFTKWWLSGRQSRSPWMRRILSSKLKTQKFVDQLSAPIKEVLANASKEDAKDISTNSFTVSVNGADQGDAGTSLDVKVLFLSPELEREHVSVRALHSFQHDA